MKFTSEYYNAVMSKDVLLVRIMLKDSLLIDKSFRQFDEMSRLAEKNGVDFWEIKPEKFQMLPQSEWNLDLMNLELTMLVSDFTKERAAYCKKIIRKVYGVSLPNERTEKNSMTDTSPFCRVNSPNQGDYKTILNSLYKINEIVNSCKSTDGSIKWIDKDIDSIQNEAEKLNNACKRIKARRR